MKKIISLTIIFILLLTLILSSCVDNVNNTSDVSNTAEDSSFEESSESPESITESNDDSSENSEVQSNAEVTENSSEHIDESDVSQDEIKYDFNEEYPDYCTCGALYYDQEYWYELRYSSGELKDYLIKNGYLSQDEANEFENGEIFNEDGGYINTPVLYNFIKDLSIPKEVYMEFREESLKFYEQKGFGEGGVLTDREIELFFGNYSDELIMKECSSPLMYYFEGALYNYKTLAGIYGDDVDYWSGVSDELLKRMMQDEDFWLFVYDYSQHSVSMESLNRRIAKLQAEEAEQAE